MSNMAKYFDLSIPASKRLALMRRDYEQHSVKYPRCPECMKPKSWKDIRMTTFQNLSAYVGNLSQGFNGKNPIWYCHSGPFFTREFFADEYRTECGRQIIEHAGWFCDRFQEDTIRGLVVQLSRGRFLAGYYQSGNGERVYYPEVYKTVSAAVRAADELAEETAGRYRDDSEKQGEAEELQEEIEVQLNRLKECIVLRNNACFRYARTEIKNLVRSIKESRETLRVEYADYL